MARSEQAKKKGTSMALATALVMLGLVFSKCSGFLRDIFVASRFDPLYRDSFTLAFIIPDLVFSLLIGGSIQSAITPSLSASVTRGEEERGRRAVNIFISVFSVIVAAVCALGVIFSEQIYMIYSSFNDKGPETAHLAAMASKWLFPQIFFMMLAALCIGILNAYKRFTSTAFGPTIYNIFVLLSILLFAANNEKSLMKTTAGIMLAAVIYFLFQYFIGFDKLSKFRFIWKPKDPDFVALFRRAVPILVSASVVQINMAILNWFATRFPDSGNVFALRNASTIWQLPYGIFAVAIGNVMLPSLAALYEKKEMGEASSLLSSRLRSALFLTIPSACFIAMMNVDVIKAVFQWNERYTDTDAQRAGVMLLGYSAAIISHTVVFIMNQAFYAIGKTKIPLMAGAICLISNPVMCVIFKACGMGLISMTFAYSITSIIQMCVLCIIYCRDRSLAPKNILPFIVKCGISVILMCALLFVTNLYLPSSGGKITQLLILAGKGLECVILYFVSAVIFKMPEATEWLRKFKLIR